MGILTFRGWADKEEPSKGDWENGVRKKDK